MAERAVIFWNKVLFLLNAYNDIVSIASQPINCIKSKK